MAFYAIIDTNILVSALLSSNPSSATVRVIECIFNGIITPILSDEMLCEYSEVLHRPRFKFDPFEVNTFLEAICSIGRKIKAHPSEVVLNDMKDLPFYEVFLSCTHTPKFLISGNLKHFPKDANIISPREFIELLQTTDS